MALKKKKTTTLDLFQIKACSHHKSRTWLVSSHIACMTLTSRLNTIVLWSTTFTYYTSNFKESSELAGGNSYQIPIPCTWEGGCFPVKVIEMICFYNDLPTNTRNLEGQFREAGFH